MIRATQSLPTLIQVSDLRAILSSNCWNCATGLHDLIYGAPSGLSLRISSFFIHWEPQLFKVLKPHIHEAGVLTHFNTGADSQTWPEIHRQSSSFWKKEAEAQRAIPVFLQLFWPFSGGHAPGPKSLTTQSVFVSPHPPLCFAPQLVFTRAVTCGGCSLLGPTDGPLSPSPALRVWWASH